MLQKDFDTARPIADQLASKRAVRAELAAAKSEADKGTNVKHYINGEEFDIPKAAFITQYQARLDELDAEIASLEADLAAI